MGQIEYSDSRKNIIKFPQVATTRMACPDMSGERELLQALDKVVRFDAVGEVKPVNKIALYGIFSSDNISGKPSCYYDKRVWQFSVY